jgi:c(7)-type cytochrome triheme protein
MVRLGPVLILVTAFLFMNTPGVWSAPGDIYFERPGGATGFPLGFFPHWVHRMKFRCYVCHPKIFKMKKGANKVNMQKINAGEYCSACHGKVAFPVTECGRCHPAKPGGK